MRKLKFSSVIEINKVNPYVLIPASSAALIRKGWRKALPVCLRMNGMPKIPWRINLMPKGDGSFYLYPHGDVRKASGSKVGDTVSIELEFDLNYRSGPAHPMTKEFRDALSQNELASQAWSRLIPSRKKEILRYFHGLKTPEARARNIHRAIQALSGGTERFLERIWN